MRTNCIDCIDRTNVAQYAFGLAALGRQLYALGLHNTQVVSATSNLGIKLMEMYLNMGDVLALQYGGSPAHSRVLSFISSVFQAMFSFRYLICVNMITFNFFFL